MSEESKRVEPRAVVAIVAAGPWTVEGVKAWTPADVNAAGFGVVAEEPREPVSSEDFMPPELAPSWRDRPPLL